MPCFIWPTPGFYRVTSKFRTLERPDHMGIDIGRNLDPPRAIEGADIVAVAGGTVSAVFRDHASMGNAVFIDHGGGFGSRCMHNQSNLVSVGQELAQGDAFALVGNTGRSSAPHLHFELLYYGAHVDPLRFLDPMRRSPPGPAAADAARALSGKIERAHLSKRGQASLMARILNRLFAARAAGSRE